MTINDWTYGEWLDHCNQMYQETGLGYWRRRRTQAAVAWLYS